RPGPGRPSAGPRLLSSSRSGQGPQQRLSSAPSGDRRMTSALCRKIQLSILPLVALVAGCASVSGDRAGPSGSPGSLAIHGNMTTLEISPVLLAADRYYPGRTTIKMGGVPNLFDEVAGSGEPGHADVATNAETQLLRISVRHPDVRAILNVSEGLYRIVARRSAGIAGVADLKGKRIATIAPTSSGYFLQRMLESEGLSIEDTTAIPIMPLEKMA